jgi:hypothetical protein
MTFFIPQNVVFFPPYQPLHNSQWVFSLFVTVQKIIIKIEITLVDENIY